MASKKGIAITAAIAAGIVGASFLIWFLPQGSPGTNITPTTDYRDLSAVYARHTDLGGEIDARFEQWKDNPTTSEDMRLAISSAEGEVMEMRRGLLNAQPPAEWQESYGLYVQALDVYEQYLQLMDQKVEAGDTSADDELENLREESQSLVDQSISAIPI